MNINIIDVGQMIGDAVGNNTNIFQNIVTNNN